jgi:hypothetical protein
MPPLNGVGRRARSLHQLKALAAPRDVQFLARSRGISESETVGKTFGRHSESENPLRSIPGSLETPFEYFR